MENHKVFLEQIPPLNTIATTTDNFNQIIDPDHMDPAVARLLRLLDGKRTLKQVINDNSDPELTTLKHLAKLNQLGFLEYTDADAEPGYTLDSGSAENYFSDQPEIIPTGQTLPVRREPVEEIDGNFEYSIEYIKPNFEFASPGDILHEHEKSQKRDTLLILSTDTDIQKGFFEHLEFQEAKPKNRIESNIKFGLMERSGETINILGLCMDRHFNAYMEYFSSSIHSCILLVNRKTVTLSYLNYLLTVLENKLFVPITLVLISDEKSLYHDSRELQQRIVNNENWHLLLKSEFTQRDIKDILKSVPL